MQRHDDGQPENRIAKALPARGFECAPIRASFVVFNTGAPASILAETLRGKGVLIMGWQKAPYENRTSDTIGAAAENDIFLQALLS